MPAYYELIELLGEGGMGRVYRAVHQPSGAHVALKTLRSEVRGDALRQRLLLDEASAAARLDHPAIVRLLEVGRDEDGAPFLVMELASGVPLERWLMAWPGWPRFAGALDDVLDALAVAHANGIVHCDLKPPNVLVDPDTGRARILDFGVATLLDPLRGATLQRIAGTPELMPPEQLQGKGPIGPWTDLYAFGVILAYAVRGASPFTDPDDIGGLIAQKLDRAREKVHPVRAGLSVPEELQVLIDRLIAPHPRARPRFAAEVARELAELSRRVDDDAARSTDPDPVSISVTTLDPVEPIVPMRLSPVPEWNDRSDVRPLFSRLPASEDAGWALGLREAPFVGRDDERLELESLVVEVTESGRPQLLALIGEPGVGKSRLARWGLAYVERKGRMEGAGGGYDASGADVAGGLRHALVRLLGGAEESAWSWVPDEPGLDRAALASFLRAADNAGTLPQERVVQLVHAALTAVARVRPVYLWLDDLGFAGDGAIAVVERLLGSEVPVLVVCTLRAGTDHRRAGEIARLLQHPRARVRSIDRLGVAERAALLDGIVPLAPAVAHALASRLDGSPALLEQLLRERVTSGMLVPTDIGYAPAPGIPLEAILGRKPLAEVIAARVEALIASLGDRARQAEGVLVRAALLGARFDLVALRAACGRDVSLARALDDVLDRALMSGMVRSERDGVYAFDHGLVHEVLASRGERQRMALVDAANGIQSRYGKERADIAALVAGLMRRAGDRERAWDRLLHAIERAAWASDDAAARKHLATAHAWAREDPAAEARVLYHEARAHYFALRYAEARPILARARSLAIQRGDTGFAAKCDAAEADVAFYEDRYAEADRMARRAEAAASLEDPDAAAFGALAAQRLGEIAVLRGDFDDAERWRRKTIAYTEATGQAWRARVSRMNLAELLAARGKTIEAAALQREVLEDARAARDDDGVDSAYEVAMRIAVIQGDGAGAREPIAARLAALEAAGDKWRVSGLAPFAALAAEDGDLEAATRRAIDAFRKVPHDEALTMVALRRLIDRLAERAAIALATEVSEILEAREEAYRRGLGL